MQEMVSLSAQVTDVSTDTSTNTILNTGTFAVMPAADGLDFYVVSDGADTKVNFTFDLRECPKRNALVEFFNIPPGRQLIIPDTHGNTLLQEWFRVGAGLAEYTAEEWARKIALLRFDAEFSSGLGRARAEKFTKDLYAFQNGTAPCPNQLPPITALTTPELNATHNIYQELTCAQIRQQGRNDLLPAIASRKEILNTAASFAEKCAALKDAGLGTKVSSIVAKFTTAHLSATSNPAIAAFTAKFISLATAVAQNAMALESFTQWMRAVANAPTEMLPEIIAKKKAAIAKEQLSAAEEGCKNFMLQQLAQLEATAIKKNNIKTDRYLAQYSTHIVDCFVMQQAEQAEADAIAILSAAINNLEAALNFDASAEFNKYLEQFTAAINARIATSKILYPERAVVSEAEGKESDTESDSAFESKSVAEPAPAPAPAVVHSSLAQQQIYLHANLEELKNLFIQAQRDLQNNAQHNLPLHAHALVDAPGAAEIFAALKEIIAAENQYLQNHPSFIDYNVYAAHVRALHREDAKITKAAHARGQQARKELAEPEQIPMLELGDNVSDRGECDLATISNANIAQEYGGVLSIIFSNHGGYAMDFFRVLDEYIDARFNALQRRILGTINVEAITAKISALTEEFTTAESRPLTQAAIDAYWWINVIKVFDIKKSNITLSNIDDLFDVIAVLQREIDAANNENSENLSSENSNAKIINFTNILHAAKKLLRTKCSLPDARMLCNKYPSTMSLYAWLLEEGKSHTTADGFYTQEFLHKYAELRAKYKKAFVDNLIVAESQPGGVFVTHAPGIAIVEQGAKGAEIVNKHAAHLCWARGWSLVLLKGMAKVIAYYNADYLAALERSHAKCIGNLQEPAECSDQDRHSARYFIEKKRRLENLVANATSHQTTLREFLAPEDLDRLENFLLVSDTKLRATYAASPYANALPHYNNYGVAVLKQWVDLINAAFRLLAKHSLIVTKEMDFSEMLALAALHPALSIQEEVGFFTTQHGNEMSSIDVRSQTKLGHDPLAIFNKPLAGAAGSGWIPGNSQEYIENGVLRFKVVSMGNIHGHEPYEPGRHGADSTGGMAKTADRPVDLEMIGAPGNPVMDKSMFIVPHAFVLDNNALSLVELQKIDNKVGALSVKLMRAILDDIDSELDDIDSAANSSRSRQEARTNTSGDLSLLDIDIESVPPQSAQSAAASYSNISTILSEYTNALYRLAKQHKAEFAAIQAQVNESPLHINHDALIQALDQKSNKAIFLLSYQALHSLLQHPYVASRTKSLIHLNLAALNPRDAKYTECAKRIYAAIEAARNPARNALAFIQDIKLMALVFVTGGEHVAHMFSAEAASILLAGAAPKQSALYKAMGKTNPREQAAFTSTLNRIVLTLLDRPKDALAKTDYPASTNCQVAVTPFLILSSIPFTLLMLRTMLYSIANGDEYFVPVSETLTGVPAILLLAAYPYFAYAVLLWSRQNPDTPRCKSLVSYMQKANPGGIHGLPVSFYFNFPIFACTMVIFVRFLQYIIDSFPEIFGPDQCALLANSTGQNFTTLYASFGSPCDKFNYAYWPVPVLGVALSITKIMMHHKFGTPLNPELQFAPRAFFSREIVLRMSRPMRHCNTFLHAIYHAMSVLLVLAGLFELFYNIVIDWYNNKYLMIFAPLISAVLFTLIKASLQDSKAAIVLTHLAYIFTYIYFQFKFYDAFVVNHFPIDWVYPYDGSLVGNVDWVFSMLMTAARLYAVFLGINGGIHGSEQSMLAAMAAEVVAQVTEVIKEPEIKRPRAASRAIVYPEYGSTLATEDADLTGVTTAKAMQEGLLANSGAVPNSPIAQSEAQELQIGAQLIANTNTNTATDPVAVPAIRCCTLFSCGTKAAPAAAAVTIDDVSDITITAVTANGLFSAADRTFAGVMAGRRMLVGGNSE